MFLYTGGVRAFKQKRTLLRSRTLPADATLSMQASSLRYFVALLLPTPPGYTKKQPQPRLFLYTGGVRAFKQKRTLLRSRTLPAIQNVPKAHIAPQVHRFCVHSTFVFSPRKNRPKYGRFFVVWIYCFLLNNALLILLLFVEQCFDCGN